MTRPGKIRWEERRRKETRHDMHSSVQYNMTQNNFQSFLTLGRWSDESSHLSPGAHKLFLHCLGTLYKTHVLIYCYRHSFSHLVSFSPSLKGLAFWRIVDSEMLQAKYTSACNAKALVGLRILKVMFLLKLALWCTEGPSNSSNSQPTS